MSSDEIFKVIFCSMMSHRRKRREETKILYKTGKKIQSDRRYNF